MKFKGIQIGADGRLIPSAYGKVKTFENGKTPLKSVYVGLDGDDSNPGTYDRPFGTFGKAMSVASPGTSVLIKPGVYTSQIVAVDLLHGTEENPIWIGGIPGEERPVLDGDDSGVSIIRGSYVVLHDLEVRNKVTSPTATGIHVNDGGDICDWPDAAHHFVFRNLYVHHINYQQFKFAGLAHFWLFDCEISYDICGGSAPIDGVGVHYGTIAYNYLHDYVGVAIQLKGGSFEHDIYGNLFENAAQGVNVGQTTGEQFFRPELKKDGTVFEGSRYRIYSNIFINGTTPVAFWSSTDGVFVNNTVINPSLAFFRLLPSPDYIGLANNGMPLNNIVANNIFVGNPTEPINVSAGNIGPETLVVKNNIIYNTSTPGVLPDNASVFPLFDKDNIAKDPLFEDGGCGLTAESPALGRGVAFDFAKFVKEDFYGNPVDSDKFNLGAVQ